MKKNICIRVVGAVIALNVMAAFAEEEESSLWGWSVSGGANFGFGLKSKLKMSPANAMNHMPSLPKVGQSRAEAIAARTPVRGGGKVVYDAEKGYYIDPESSWGELPGHESETWNWRLPDSSVIGSGADRQFVLDSGGEWGEYVSKSESVRNIADSDSDVAYGASVELSHGIWESEDSSWGLDIALGLTWMKATDCFKSGGVAVRRSGTVERGDTITTIPGEFFSLGYASAEDDNTWGNGTYDGSDPSRQQFVLDLDDISTSARTLSSESYSDSMSMYAHGDYEEWEISVLLRPWYDVNDWMCVHGALGVGITRSSFEYSMEAMSGGSSIYRSSQEFDEWRCYGIVGGGVLFRIWDFDLSCDGLFRWCQQDMDIHGRDVDGSIEKPWAVVRVGLSYAF